MSVTTDRDALVAAVIAAPDDDTPRLIFADYIEERGESEYAEFIRLQCRQAVLGRANFPHDHDHHGLCERCEEYAVVKARADKLLIDHGREWLRDAVPGGRVSNWSPHSPEPYFVLPGGNHFVNVQVARGFVAWVSLPLAAFAGDGMPCHACEDAPMDWETGVVDCRQCDSTGILLEPLAADLFRMHPIRYVEIDDRRPVLSRHGHSWFGPNHHPTADPGRLPDELWSLLPKVDYPTVTEAVNALSAACVKYGRAKAAGG